MGNVAVFDVGKTNLKLLAVAGDGRIAATLTTPNAPQGGPPYLHVDVAAIERWLLGALAELARSLPISAIVATGHGGGGVLVDKAGPVLPMMDYEAEPPPGIHERYAAIVPPFEERQCLVLGANHHLARQLLWQSRGWPEAFAGARHLLPIPQYWTWRLSGVPAGEKATLGAQSHLWNPRTDDFTSMIYDQGWRRLFPPIRKAWSVVGPVTPAVVEATGVLPSTPVLCGLHDSSANYYRYLAGGLEDFTLLSTGTWIVGFDAALPLDRLDEPRSMMANTDVHGRPVASIMAMAGREFAALAGDRRAAPTAADIAGVVAAGTFALPSFADADGAFPGSAGGGRIVGPAPHSPAGRVALATLYAALVGNRCLDLLGSAGRIVIDGGFTESPLFAGLIAALRPDQEVVVSTVREGTALGAAALWWHGAVGKQMPLDLGPVAPVPVPDLAGYAAQWLDRAEDPPQPKGVKHG